MKSMNSRLKQWGLGLALVGMSAVAQTVTYFHNEISGLPMIAADADGNVLCRANYRSCGDRRSKQPASTHNTIGLAGLGLRWGGPQCAKGRA